MNIGNTKSRKSTFRPVVADQPLRIKRDHPWMILQQVVDLLDGYLSRDEATRVRTIIRSRDWVSYMQLSEDWGLQRISSNSSPSDVHYIRAKLTIATLLKKMESETPDPALDDVAFRNVIKGEELCHEFNTRGRRRVQGSRILELAQSFCLRVLGPEVTESVFNQDCRHGPGVTTSNSFKSKDVFYKNADWPYRVTSRGFVHARKLIESDQRWLDALELSYRKRYGIEPWEIIDQDSFWATVLVVQDSNKITTVPKDRSKNRPIAIENNLNVMLQLGVDGFVRKRLRRMGINLNSQKKNQLLARSGSWRCDKYRSATIDLANASDTVSLGVCKLLLPEEWYNYLLDLRSTHGIFPDGTKIRYRKISSMGNGYTFAIESLVFAALAYATTVDYYGYYPRKYVSVFGDDIIVPELCANELARNLEAFGFSVNITKSFLQGPVKESCGSDWFKGLTVRTTYLKNRLHSLSDVYSARNRLIRYFALTFPEIDCAPLDRLFLKWIGGSVRHLGPCSDTEFDTYWHTPIPPRWRNGKYEFSSLRFYLSTISERQIPFGNLSQRLRSRPDFNFLKLSARLKKSQNCQWTKLMSSATGNAFDIKSFISVRSQNIRRSVPDWNETYSHAVAELRINAGYVQFDDLTFFPSISPFLGVPRAATSAAALGGKNV